MSNILKNSNLFEKTYLNEKNSFENFYNREFGNLIEKLYAFGLEFYSYDIRFHSNFVFEDETHKEKILKFLNSNIFVYANEFSSLYINNVPFLVFNYVRVFPNLDLNEFTKNKIPSIVGIFAINPIVPEHGDTFLINIKHALGEYCRENLLLNPELNVQYINNFEILKNYSFNLHKELDLSKFLFYFYSKINPFENLFKEFFEFIALQLMGYESHILEYFRSTILPKYTYFSVKTIDSSKNNQNLIINFYSKNNRKFNEFTLLSLINIFMKIENLYFSDNNIHKIISDENSSIKFQRLYSFEYLLNNFYILLDRFDQNESLKFYLEYVSILPLVLIHIDSLKDFLKKNPNISLPYRSI